LIKLHKQIFFAITLLATLALGAMPSQAQYHDQEGHPAYLHALSDLRLMRAYLDQLTPSERIDEASQNAIAEIDQAMRLIKDAAIFDGKDLRDHPYIDAHIAPWDRFHKAREAGDAAFNDINRGEENFFARGLKKGALDHIARANQIVDHIIEHTDHRGGGYPAPPAQYNPPPAQYMPPPPPPADHRSYQRALPSLRLMRAYLEVSTPNVRIDMETQSAIDSINSVIRDIRQSGIDYERAEFDHPHVDPRMPLPERLHLAREAGNRAWGEIDHDGDFAFAGGLKHRAMDQIEHANHIVDHILERR
jgi:hypothetical protein